MTPEQRKFLQQAAPGARASQREFGVPASVTLAQAAIESGWGRFHMGSANNYFGIKAGSSPGPIASGTITLPTKEFSGGRMITVSGRFRAYRSMADSLRDHGLFLKSNSRYAPAFRVASDPNAFARALQTAGYATDPHYADKLIATMRANDLYRFDRPGGHHAPHPHPDPLPAPRPAPPPKPAPPPLLVAHPGVAAVQRDLNTFYRRLGAPEELAVDGVWDAYTDRAFRRVCRILGIPPKRTRRTFRIIAGANGERTQEELDRAQTEGAAFAAELEALFREHKPAPAPAPGPLVVGGTPLDARRRRAAYIAALQRDLNVQLERLGSPSPLRVDGEWDAATDLAFRRVCKILGIAPERRIRTFRVIAGCSAQRTAAELQEAETDGADFARRLGTFFHTEQRQPLEPAPTPTPTPAPGPAPRTFRIQSPLMTGDDVKAFQRLLNARYAAWHVNKRIEEDGEYGSITRLAARQVAHGLGLAKRDYPGGITPEMRRRMRHPDRRTPEEIERAQRRRPWLRALRHQFAGGGAELALRFARSQLAVRESAGANRGPQVDRYNRVAGYPLASFWCGTFMNACLMAAGFPSEHFLGVCGDIEHRARTGQGGWSWHSVPKPGDLVLYTERGAANHVGMVESVGASEIVTIEGNTHPDHFAGPDDDGFGVFRRHRPRSLPRGYARPPYAR
jgi:Mannosyl-glycoprotein endo-beta-N-acetylglucosaminidase/CHAP domain